MPTFPPRPAGQAARHAAVALAFASPALAGAQTFVVRPGPDVLAGDPVAVTLAGLAPGALVDVTAERLAAACCATGAPNLLRARARFRADRAGRVDLAAAAPLPSPASTYAGPDAAGLFWSMRLTPTYVDTAGLSLGPGRVRLSVRPVPPGAGPADSSLGGSTVHPAPLAAAVVTLRASDPAVAVDSVPGFPGAVFAHLPTAAGAPPRPALIVLGGSEGGSSFARRLAPRLASRGYAVLGLPYYSPGWGGRREVPSLPASFVDVPVERLDSARAWLAARPGVDGSRVGLYGVSKGAEYALLGAAHLPWVRAVAAVAPSDVVWEGWGPASAAEGTRASFALGGRALPFVPYAGMQAEFAAAQAAGRAPSLRSPHANGRLAHPGRAEAARIPVERYRGPLLVAGGGVDDVWPSAEMAQAIAERRRRAGLPTVLLVFPGVGHALSGDGWSPTTGVAQAGAPAATAAAQAATWRATLALFDRALRPAAP